VLARFFREETASKNLIYVVPRGKKQIFLQYFSFAAKKNEKFLLPFIFRRNRTALVGFNLFFHEKNRCIFMLHNIVWK
jgi:hypothetical protein